MTVNHYVLEHLAHQFLAEVRAEAARQALARSRPRRGGPTSTGLSAALARLVAFLRPGPATSRGVACPAARR